MNLELKNIQKSIEGTEILSNISFSVGSKEIVGLLGPNGAGKTTAFYIAAGLLYPDKGSIFLSDCDVTSHPMHKRAKVGLSYLPQEASIFQELTVKENIMGIAELVIANNSKQREFLEQITEEFELGKLLNKKGRMLSGGQRRKVEIARTLASNPSILLLDEPFAGIDPIAVEEIKHLLSKIIKKDISVLITDHNVQETLKLCDRSIIMNEGNIIAEGKPSELIQNDLVKKIYFGKMYS